MDQCRRHFRFEGDVLVFPLPFFRRLNQVTYSVGRKMRVRMVPTRKPPMMAMSIGPQNTVGAIGMRPSTVETAVSMIGVKRALLALIAAWTHALAHGALGLHLADQDHGVLGDHADQRQNAENGDEAERAARNQAAPPRRRSARAGRRLSTKASRCALPSSTISTVSMMRSISGTIATTEASRLRAFLDRSAGVDPGSRPAAFPTAP